jgi:hypothetical protein
MEIGKEQITYAKQVMAELMIWTFADETSSSAKRYLVGGNYVLVCAQLAQGAENYDDAVRHEFIDGLTDNGGSPDRVGEVANFFLEDDRFRLCQGLDHIPREQTDAGISREAHGESWNNQAFIEAIILLGVRGQTYTRTGV